MVNEKERRYLHLDDVLEVVAFLLSAARNVVGGRSETASQLLLDSAERVISCVVDNEKDATPEILRHLAAEIIACRDLYALEPSAYVDLLDEMLRTIARDMLERSNVDEVP